MTCHLFGAKPFPEPMLTYCSLDILNKLYESTWHKPFCLYVTCDGLSPFWCQAISWANADILFNGPFWTNSMYVYGMSHLLPMCDISRVCIEVYCLLNWSSLIHVVACHLTGDMPLFEPQQTYCSLKPLNKLRLYFAETITIVIIKRKRFPYCWASVRGSHGSLVGSLHRDHQCGCFSWC